MVTHKIILIDTIRYGALSGSRTYMWGGVIKLSILFSIFAVNGVIQATLVLHGLEHMTEERGKTLKDLLTSRASTANWEALEMRYQALVQPQIFSDLIQLYDPRNAGKVRITYASFTPENGSGDDIGFGLHIVKRLTIHGKDGRSRRIDVNEHWAMERRTGGLLLPDEIRIKSLVFEGERGSRASQKLYLFDSFRLAWSESREIAILRRSVYDGVHRMNTLRAPVSAPFSCQGCHLGRSSDSFADDFLADEEARDFEAIVQPSCFQLPPEKMRGFREYIEHLKEMPSVDGNFIGEVEENLSDISRASTVPGLRQALIDQLHSLHWIHGDRPWARTYSYIGLAQYQQGTYLLGDTWYLDEVEEHFEGKYRWWLPEVVIPFPSY